MAAAAGAAVSWLWARSERMRVQAGAARRADLLQSEARNLQKRLARSESDLEAAREEISRLSVSLARTDEQRRAETEKQEFLIRADSQLRETFAALSSRILEGQRESLVRTAAVRMDGLMREVRGDWEQRKSEFSRLVSPLADQLSRLEDQVNEMERRREGAYEGLSGRLEQMNLACDALRGSAARLTEALKSPTARGRWGEIQLRRIAELSGMQAHISFSEQAAASTGERPDMLVHLPENGVLPVDAKLPMDAYLEAAETGDDRRRQEALARHAAAVRGRIRDLGRKEYWRAFAASPDFVILFIPNDACLGAAFEQAPDLLEYAMERRVMPATPVTLLALLKTVAYGWRQRDMADSARQIAEQGKELFDRLRKFADHFADLHLHLDRAVGSYNRAAGSFERRLMPSARRFYETGLSPSPVNAPLPVERRPAGAMGLNGVTDNDGLTHNLAHTKEP